MRPADFMAMTGLWVMETGVWVPAFAGMTGVEGVAPHVYESGLVSLSITGLRVMETGAWVPAFAGMTGVGGWPACV